MRGRTQLLVAVAVTVATAAGACAPPNTPTTAAVRIGTTPVEFRVEVAKTAEQQRDGLSGRSKLSAGTGMLFRFGSRSVEQVWMAGMTIPLDIAWIADGKVVATDTLTGCTETDETNCPKWTSPTPVDALLEVPAHSLGTVIPGMTVTIDEER